MVKEFTAAEKALLDSKPGDLDPIQKKDRERLKARIYMEKHRNKLKETKGIEDYKTDRKNDMKKYRFTQKTTYLKAVEEASSDSTEKKTITNTIQKIEKKYKESILPVKEKSQREKKPVDRLKIVQDVPKVNTKQQQEMSDKSPQWLGKLIKISPNYKVNDETYVSERAYGKPAIDSHIKRITAIMDNVEGKKMSQDLKSKITTVLRGMNIEQGKYKTDISVFKKEMPFLDLKKVDTFIDNVIRYVTKKARREDKIINTIRNSLNPFVNLLGRIDSYSKSYQILTKFNSLLNKQYIDERSENVVDEEDIDKITLMKEKWDYTNVERTNKLIQDANLNKQQQALASVFLLQPPRRLDHQHAVLTSQGLDEDSLKSLEGKVNDKLNYLVMDGTEPVRWVYKNFKTAAKGGKVKYEVFGTQVYDVMPEVARYLKAHIVKNKLNLGDHIFGQLKDAREKMTQGNYSKLIPEIMFKIFDIPGITATVLRTAAAIFNQQTEGRSNKDKREFALSMAHSEATNQLYNKIIPKIDRKDIPVKEEEEEPEKKQDATPVKNPPKVLKAAEKVGNKRMKLRKRK